MIPTFFLPGAGGSADFWRPAADLIPASGPRHFFAWPGLGEEAADPSVRSLDDLARIVLARLDGPTDLVAQSMGGVVAVKVALAAPEKVRRLVLTVTSGGVPMGDLGAARWQEDYRRDFPRAAAWIMDPVEDLSLFLPGIAVPTLLLWGDSDPISPLAVARRLRDLLPEAGVHVVKGGGHDLARTHAEEAAGVISAHLA